MLTNDVLPPASEPFVAELLFTGPFIPDAEAITARLAKRGVPLGDKRWERDNDGLHIGIRGGEMRITTRDARLPDAKLAPLLEDAESWWDVSAVPTHKRVIEVHVQSTEHSALSTARLAVRLSAAILDCAAHDGTPAVAALWNGERLLPPDFLRDQARTEPPLGILIGMHVAKPGSGLALYTSGLPALGLMNIQVAAVDGDLQAAAMIVQHWAHALITQGPSAITPGTTIGSSPADRVHVTLAGSRGEQVYHLSFGKGAPVAPEPPKERVTCPECGKRVIAEVRKTGFLKILMKCPECGAGPVALIADMIDTVGGGEVTVTFETTDAVALAKLLSEHDPRFETIVDAADYLRDRYDGRRAVVQMQRKVAGLVSAAVGRDYPNIRIAADEALGVMDPPGEGGIFHAASNDQMMSEAIDAARASVGEFIARMEAPQPGDTGFGIKARFDDASNGQTEHMWLDSVRREGREFVGILEASPDLVKNVRRGQEVRVPIDQISDWGFSNGEAMHGNYTLRVMLGSLPKQMQDAFRARLVPLK